MVCIEENHPVPNRVTLRRAEYSTLLQSYCSLENGNGGDGL